MAPFRKAQLPRWRSLIITHPVAERILKSAGHEPEWHDVDEFKVLPLSEMGLAVAEFLNRLHAAGVRPYNVQVVFHPESDYSGSGDWRSRYTVFYFGLIEVEPP